METCEASINIRALRAERVLIDKGAAVRNEPAPISCLKQSVKKWKVFY
jgi:hypothetical protein